MIRIDRNPRRALAEAQKQALLVLQKGELELADLEKLAAAGSLESKSFKREIYAADEVRDYLWQLQKYKCCFCERKFECKYSTIEHFRPRTKAERAAGSSWGYWWLAYELKNLYFCCQICNNLKSNFFPLVPGSEELVPREKPWESRDQEKPLLLDPGFDEPEEHLTFEWLPNQKKIYPVAVNGSLRGKATAARILDRDDLQDPAGKTWQKVDLAGKTWLVNLAARRPVSIRRIPRNSSSR